MINLPEDAGGLKWFAGHLSDAEKNISTEYLRPFITHQLEFQDHRYILKYQC